MNAGKRTTSRRGRATLAMTLAAGLSLVASAPTASAATIYSGPQASTLNYLNPDLTISAGEPLALQNYDLVSHDITSEEMYQPPRPKRKKGKKRPKRPPPELLFKSALIGFAQRAPVTGLERLKPGVSYPFFCSLHLSMTGTLTVRP